MTTTSTTCRQCGEPLTGYRPQARFCSNAHGAAYRRAQTAHKPPRVEFPRGVARDKALGPDIFVGIVPDTKYSGMYRLKRTDGSLSDMVNLTRAKDALAHASEAA